MTKLVSNRLVSPWDAIKDFSQMESSDYFVKTFFYLKNICEIKTGIRLNFTKQELREVFSIYINLLDRSPIRSMSNTHFIELSSQIPAILAGAILFSFHKKYPSDSGPGLVRLRQPAISKEDLFTLYYCVEHYLFLAGKIGGQNHSPSLDPLDLEIAEQILVRVRYKPDFDYSRLFHSLNIVVERV